MELIFILWLGLHDCTAPVIYQGVSHQLCVDSSGEIVDVGANGWWTIVSRTDADSRSPRAQGDEQCLLTTWEEDASLRYGFFNSATGYWSSFPMPQTTDDRIGSLVAHGNCEFSQYFTDRRDALMLTQYRSGKWADFALYAHKNYLPSVANPGEVAQ